jgi:hypothetical protein
MQTKYLNILTNRFECKKEKVPRKEEGDNLYIVKKYCKK